jgi:hypothetical protein
MRNPMLDLFLLLQDPAQKRQIQGLQAAFPSVGNRAEDYVDRYDYTSARKYGIRPTIDPVDGKPHWPSRAPNGQILKMPGHLSWWKTVAGENEKGFRFYRQKKTGRLFTFDSMPGEDFVPLTYEDALRLR